MTTIADDEATAQASRVTRCRSCGGADLREFLSLGSTPVANALFDPAGTGRPDPSFPLALTFCRSCSLVQLAHELPAEAIFGADCASSPGTEPRPSVSSPRAAAGLELRRGDSCASSRPYT